MATRTWMDELAPAECRHLVASALLGRIAVFVDGRPEIFPVNHVFDPVTGTVVFPSKPGTKMWGALHWPWMSFEVDGIDPDGQSAWSVLVVGRGQELTAAEDVRRAASLRQVRWAAGPATHWIALVPAKVSGRRIRLVVEP